jgi:hypothetical protein
LPAPLKVTAVAFYSFKQLQARFEKEWRGLVREVKDAQD